MNDKEKSIITTFVELFRNGVLEFVNVSKVQEIIADNPVGGMFVPKTGFWGNKKSVTFPPFFIATDFQNIIKKIVEVISKSFGFDFTEAFLERIYTKLEEMYPVDLVGDIILPYIPSGYMEQHRVQYLSKEELKVEVLKKTEELEKLNDELEGKIKERTIELEKLLIEQRKGAKILIKRDMELIKANEKLQELDKIKSDFISVAAHQLRTPLSGVKWTLGMLISGDLGPLNDEQKTFLMKTSESNARMIALVNDMLVADGVQSWRVRYGFKYTNIIDLIDNVLFELGPQAVKRHVKIEYKNKFKNLPEVYIDPGTMRAVFQNLLENAVKYTVEGGRVEVDIKREDKHLTISITDTGIGIPKDQVKNIFVKFFRARNAISKETDGTGLGLYIAKTIIEKNGGKIWFESVEGKGSTFYFTVPLQESE